MKEVQVNQVVQLTPSCKNQAFAYCLMVISEVKSWGVQGYVQALGTREEPGGQAYYRATWEEFESLQQDHTAPWVSE